MAYKCNGCWADATAGEHGVVTGCGHLFCVNCAQMIIESDDSTCPICQQVMTKHNVRAVKMLLSDAQLKLALAGQTPEAAMTAAMASIQFYNTQQALYAEAARQKMEHKIDKTQDQCRKKLTEVHTGYLTAKRKYQESNQLCQALQRDIAELQEKYNQKAMQDKKLKEMVQQLQQENSSMRQLLSRVGGGGGGGGSVPLNIPSGFNGGSGGGMAGGRPPSRTFGGDTAEDELGLRLGSAGRRASLGGRPPFKELSPLQSPNFQPNNPFGAFDTPANQPVGLRNALNTNQFPQSASKPIAINFGRRASLLNPNSPSGMASL